MSDRLAVYPGTFDPVTNGHVSLVERALHLFDRVIIAVAESGGKNPLFDCDDRVALMREAIGTISGAERVEVEPLSGLLSKFVTNRGAAAIVRGLRAVSDFEYEFQMALMNRKLARDVETIFLMPSLSWVYLSSSLVKDVGSHGGDISGLVPDRVLQKVLAQLTNKQL